MSSAVSERTRKQLSPEVAGLLGSVVKVMGQLNEEPDVREELQQKITAVVLALDSTQVKLEQASAKLVAYLLDEPAKKLFTKKYRPFLDTLCRKEFVQIAMLADKRDRNFWPFITAISKEYEIMAGRVR